ncbi:sensor domain-containing diguanylate cyclase [Aliidiomarina indica]|uniref:sensor domain-containing diguanylate cyclase n=1 Tax=Aliidiomarina indica TaxID=2749147 RepID=UPI00188E3EB5|nr:sensor domain-containing diguanylate cyclase [Aliidiomarina indica]
MTDRKSITTILQDKEYENDHLDAIFRHFPGFVYQLRQHPDGRLTYPYASSSAHVLFGINPESLRDDGMPLLKLIHPNDYDRIMESTARSVETMCEWHEEYRMVVAGKTIWLAAYDIPARMSDGSILFNGYATVITERKILEARLAESERTFRALVESANDVIYTLNPDGAFTYISPMWTEQLGHQRHEVIGRPFTQFVHPDDLETCFSFLQEIVTLGKKRAGIEYRILHKNGSVQWHMSNASPIFDDDGVVIKYMGIARDITESKHLQHKMEKRANFDLLTELPNRQLFFSKLESLIGKCVLGQLQVALMFIDLDYFKPVNDKFGHAVGDLVLQEVALRLRRSLREGDLVGRIGGDEFVVALADLKTPENTPAIAQATAERILTAIAEPFAIEGNTHHISCSIGIALYPEHAENAVALARLADEAMYTAKSNGRGRFELYQSVASRVPL